LNVAAELGHIAPPIAALAADELSEAGVLEPGLPLRFVHPLVRTAVYEDFPPAQRALRHADAATILDRLNAPPDRRAQHLLAVGGAGDADVVDLLTRAAALASESGALDAAVAYLRRALAEPPPVERRAEILRRLGESEVVISGPVGLATLEAAAAASVDDLERAEIALSLARAAFSMAEVYRPIPVLEHARDALHAGSDVRVSVEAQLLQHELPYGPRSGAAVDAMVAIVDRGDLDRITDASMLAVLAAGVGVLARPRDSCIDLAYRALTALDPVNPDQSTVFYAALVLMLADELAAAAAIWDVAVARASAAGSALGFNLASAFRGGVHLRTGDLRKAEADARAADTITREWGLRGGDVPALLSQILIERGQLTEAEQVLGAAPLGAPETWAEWILLYARGQLRLAQGRMAEAVDDLLETGRLMFGGMNANTATFAWRSGAALGLAALQRQDEAVQLVEEEVRLARQFGAPRALGVALRAAGLTRGGASGHAELEEAVSVLEGSAARLEYARAQVDLGAALRRAGARRDAREPLRQGMELAHECSADALVERARTELLAAGARPRRIERTGVNSLTPAELRVAQMAASGLGNQQIAQQLFVTRKTVETQMGAVLRKLDLASRTEVAAALTNYL
jgi:DNA-binding CsgD family transcriptional regulator